MQRQLLGMGSWFSPSHSRSMVSTVCAAFEVSASWLCPNVIPYVEEPAIQADPPWVAFTNMSSPTHQIFIYIVTLPGSQLLNTDTSPDLVQLPN